MCVPRVLRLRVQPTMSRAPPSGGAGVVVPRAQGDAASAAVSSTAAQIAAVQSEMHSLKQEIQELKRKIKAAEDEKDKEAVARKEALLISQQNMLTELQKKENGLQEETNIHTIANALDRELTGAATGPSSAPAPHTPSPHRS